MTLAEWAVRHGVSPEAIAELASLIKHDTPDKPPSSQPAGSEQYVQTEVRLEASEKGHVQWRNNSGVVSGYVVAKKRLSMFCPKCVKTLTDKIGYTHYRHGLCNDSKQMNEKIKSSDLVGVRKVVIRPEHVGHVFGVIMVREVKHEDWEYKGTKREKAQLKFLELVIAMGGDACFTTGRGTI